MRLPIYQVDAFSADVFGGNPAAVCPLKRWLADETLQAIAAENALSETAFFLHGCDPAPLRWFTPTQEVPLCGHATLAAGFVVLDLLARGTEAVTFSTLSGELTVRRDGDVFRLDLPALKLDSAPGRAGAIAEALGRQPEAVLVNHADPNLYAILPDEAMVRAACPDLSKIAELHPFGLAISAPGRHADFVSRYFAPGYGIPEDPVTGSIHCALGPYWSGRLGRSRLTAEQLSARGGRLDVHVSSDRVRIGGRAALYLAGELRLPAG